MTTREGETMNPAEAFFAVIEQADREARKAALAREVAMQIVYGTPCESCRARKPDVQRRNFLGESVWICDWCMGAAAADELGEGLKCL